MGEWRYRDLQLVSSLRMSGAVSPLPHRANFARDRHDNRRGKLPRSAYQNHVVYTKSDEKLLQPLQANGQPGLISARLSSNKLRAQFAAQWHSFEYCPHILFWNSTTPLQTISNTKYQALLTYSLTPWSRVLLEKLTGFAANQEIHRILWKP